MAVVPTDPIIGVSRAGEAYGFVLLLLTFALPLLLRAVRRSWGLIFAFTAVIALHQLVALTNAYVTTVPGAELDAKSFHQWGGQLAMGNSEGVAMWEIYPRALGWLYGTFGTSHLLGEETSLLAWVVALMLFVLVARELEQKITPGVILLYGIVPSALIYCSITMREAWETLFVAIVVLSVLRMRRRPGWRPMFWMSVGGGGMTVLHHGLAVYAAFVIVVALWWAYGRRIGRRFPWRRVAGVFIAVALLVVWRAIASGTAVAAITGAVNPVAILAAFRSSATAEARTTYPIPLDPSSPLSALVAIPLMLIDFEITPLPWQIQTGGDALVAAEVVLRLVVMAYAVAAWRRSRGELRARRFIVLLLFVALEALWSLGTTTWGTAFRHRIPGYGIIVMLGAPLLLARLGGIAAWFIPPPRVPRRAAVAAGSAAS